MKKKKDYKSLLFVGIASALAFIVTRTITKRFRDKPLLMEINHSDIKKRPSPSVGKSLKIYNSLPYFLTIAIISLFFGDAFLWIGVEDNNILLILIATIFGGWTIYNFIQLFNWKPRVIVDERGIETFRHQHKFIPWADIGKVWAKSARYNKMLCIEVRADCKNIHSSPSFLQNLSNATGYGDARIEFTWLNKTSIEALYFIAQMKNSKRIPSSVEVDLKAQYGVF